MTGKPQSHDALKTLADFRDHLARHDKPIAFFFGAGTSSAVRVPSKADATKAESLVPAVAALTTMAKTDAGALGASFAKAWTAIEEQCKAGSRDPNVENILSRVRIMLSAIGEGDTLAGLKKADIQKLEECVRKTIARVVTPDLTRIPGNFPHRKFSRWLFKTARQKPVAWKMGEKAMRTERLRACSRVDLGPPCW